MSLKLPPTQAAIRLAFQAANAESNGEAVIQIVDYIQQQRILIEQYDYILIFSVLRQHTKFADKAVEILYACHDNNEKLPLLCYGMAMINLQKARDWRKAIHLLLHVLNYS